MLAFQALPPLQFTCHMLEQAGASVLTVVNDGRKAGSTMDLQKNYFGEQQAEIALDLKNPRDREFLLKEIVPEAEVLLESYRPGVMEKLGLSPEAVHQRNPKVIYGRLSGFGQVQSKYRERAGHDINYLALTGVLSRFKRDSANNAPTFPANILADFASGSSHLFSQVLQALLLGQERTVLDCSLAHSTLYLSQLELLREARLSSLNRSRLGLPLAAFTRAHERLYQDRAGQRFVLRPGSPLHEALRLQRHNEEEAEEAKALAEVTQIAFAGMELREIEREYGGERGVERVRQLEEVVSGGRIPEVYGAWQGKIAGAQWADRAREKYGEYRGALKGKL